MRHDSTVHRFRMRHRVRDDAEARRCQAAQQALLDGELEAAFMRVAADDEVIVVRRLQAHLRLVPARSDRDNARRWGDQLGAALQRSLQHGSAGDVQRFASAQRAQLAFVVDLLARDRRRHWTWQRLGWLPATDTRENDERQCQAALLRLTADDEASVPLLRTLLLARGAAWRALIERLADGELQGLTAGVRLWLGAAPGAAFTATPAFVVPASWPASIDGLAGAWATALHGSWLAASTSARRVWALRLSALLLDPPLARRGPDAVDHALRQWLPADATAAAAATVSSRAQPTEDEAAAPDDEAPCFSDFAGLLFVLPLFEPAAALPLLEDAAAWPAGSLPFALHRLALQLQPMAPDDAAALAFCGRGPRDDVPDPQRTPTAAQQRALDEARRRLLDHLAERLPDWRGPGLLPRLVQRRARFVADPGWIDVHFSLRDVALELRRAAIDLDPGFIPWLGLVLRYRYE